MTTRLMLTAVAALTASSMVACGGAKEASYSPSSAPSEPAAQGYPQPSGVEADSGGDGMSADDMAPPAPEAAGARAEAKAPSAKDPFHLSKPQNRPGLATSWGETRHSRVSTAPFVRAHTESAFAIGTVFYNDPQGIAAMSDSHPGSRHHRRAFRVGAGHIEVSLRDGSGNFLTGFETGGNNYVTGVSGRRYTIVVKNHSPGRVEAVVSVDGLDVVDGKPASTQKRGYLIDPFGDLEVEGFRTSNSEVAAFRFGAVGQSYAAKKHGSTRNVGVIGVAMFHERGDDPNRWGTPGHDDSDTRRGADPFPQKYASPP